MANLLLADDQPEELQRLEQVLATEGHHCTTARDGAEAIKRWRADRHDLVILDYKMPGLNGIKATQRLKAVTREERSYVPILVVTGFEGSEYRQEAYEAGADDFLSKPVEDWELRARVRTFLHIQAQLRATEEALKKLEAAQRLRDELMELIVHDLKNPLASLSSNLEFVAARLKGDPEARDAVADSQASTARLHRMVTVLLDVDRLEEGHLQPNRELSRIAALLESCQRGRHHEAKLRRITLDVESPPQLQARIDLELLRRVLDNLLDNALRYAPVGGAVRLGAAPGPLGIRITVWNSGPPIPQVDRERIFAKYERLASGRASRGSGNRGIGLYFCRLAVEAHGGRIGADDAGGAGARFLIDLPA